MWDEADRVMALVKEHLARRPAMEPRDIYKLLYQGMRGPEHHHLLQFHGTIGNM
jgi:hypothetical protein